MNHKKKCFTIIKKKRTIYILYLIIGEVEKLKLEFQIRVLILRHVF